MELKELKVGDKVIIRNRWNDRIKTIERVTKTQIIVNGDKYRRKDGFQINGDTWTPSRIEVLTEEELRRMQKQNNKEKMKRYIQNFVFDDLSYDEIEHVYNILKKLNNKNHGKDGKDGKERI